MGAAAEAIKQLTTDDIVAYEATGTITVGDLELKEGELKARPCAALCVANSMQPTAGGVAQHRCLVRGFVSALLAVSCVGTPSLTCLPR